MEFCACGRNMILTNEQLEKGQPCALCQAEGKMKKTKKEKTEYPLRAKIFIWSFIALDLTAFFIWCII
jgi:hypothetical protein